MKEFNVYLTGKAHQADCLVLDLSHKGSIVFILSGDQFGYEILTVGLSDSLTLAVKYVGQIIMILLLGISHFYVGKNEHA
jgi:hypothetical protein